MQIRRQVIVTGTIMVRIWASHLWPHLVNQGNQLLATTGVVLHVFYDVTKVLVGVVHSHGDAGVRFTCPYLHPRRLKLEWVLLFPVILRKDPFLQLYFCGMALG